MAPQKKPHTTTMSSTVGWSASAFVAAVIARLIRKGLELQVELDEAAVGHLRRLEGLLAPIWRVLDAADADAGAIDLSQRPLQDLLDAAYTADNALDDLEYAFLQIDVTRGNNEQSAGAGAANKAVGPEKKPRSPLRFLLCFSPPRNIAGSSTGGFKSTHGKSSAKKWSSVNFEGLRDAFELVAQAAYRCTSMYEHVVPRKNYATSVSVQPGDARARAKHDGYDIFAREVEVEQIMEKVRLGDDLHYRLGVGVLPVVGAAGVGKTALAQLVFHHQVTKAEFPVRLWLHVSGALVVGDQLLIQMVRGDTDNVDIRNLLVEQLTGKRFLLVIDNVTDASDAEWKCLMEVLQPAASRSLILVTTQSESVAAAIGTMPTFILGPMSFGDYLKMFKHFAFGAAEGTEDCTPFGDEWEDLEEDEEELSPMEQILHEIAKNMGCLPLPAQVIGRSLYFRRGEEVHWKKVLEDRQWEEQDGEISPALLLGYQHLDPRLKQCFVYCAVFPNNYVIRRDELGQMWIAHGFIYSDDPTKTPEDIAGMFFDELVERCFFQAIGGDRYVIHDTMQQLARTVSGSQSYMVTESSGEVPHEVRHLTIRTDNMSKLRTDLALQLFPSSHHHFLQRVRTILFCADLGSSDEFMDILAEIFSIAKSVRVLRLSCANITFLPAEMGLLRHLRYLDLSGNKITYLPEAVCQLQLLQALDVKCNSQYLRPPSDVTNLIHLRHLHASELFLSGVPDIHNLSDLQEMEVFRVGGCTHINALQQMMQLRGTLCIVNLCHVGTSDHLKKGILKGMKHLRKLHLTWESSVGERKGVPSDEEVLECLQPNENIKVLKITGYSGIRSPSWMLKTSYSLWNATSVYLSDCTNWKILPPLHIMPCLEVLEIRKMHSIIKVRLVPQRSDEELFPKLTRLVIEDAFHCTEWSTGNSTRVVIFPCLDKLEIRNCPDLMIFPCVPLSLTTMIIDNVGLEMLPRIDEKQTTTEEEEGMSTSGQRRWTSLLSTLKLHQCHRLRSLGSGLLQQQHLLRSLEVLSIKNCNNITSDLPDGFKDLIALRDLSLYDCPKLLVDKFHTSLRTIEISECFVVHGGWVEEYPFLFSVWTLKISGCSHARSDDGSNNIENLSWLSCMFNVYSLQLKNTLFVRLNIFEKLHSLEILEIDGCQVFFDDDSSDLEWLDKLHTLSIRNCNELCRLPENLCTLPALEELCIDNCQAIQALPAKGLPTSLQRVWISKCSPNLTHRCLDNELDRTKIADISVVYIDGQCVTTRQE